MMIYKDCEIFRRPEDLRWAITKNGRRVTETTFSNPSQAQEWLDMAPLKPVEHLPADKWALSPWVPMTVPIDKKHIGKLLEELGEAVAAASRCLIQGINEKEPVTHKPNKEWLEDELADVLANITLCQIHFKLDEQRMAIRQIKKMQHLSNWHRMLA